jgi:hypothetical protein
LNRARANRSTCKTVLAEIRWSSKDSAKRREASPTILRRKFDTFRAGVKIPLFPLLCEAPAKQFVSFSLSPDQTSQRDVLPSKHPASQLPRQTDTIIFQACHLDTFFHSLFGNRHCIPNICSIDKTNRMEPYYFQVVEMTSSSQRSFQSPQSAEVHVRSQPSMEQRFNDTKILLLVTFF